MRSRKAPIVNLNTAAMIKELVGDWNDENKDIILAIADSEEKLMSGCSNMQEYAENINNFINNWSK